jgi:hypothetical protein
MGGKRRGVSVTTRGCKSFFCPILLALVAKAAIIVFSQQVPDHWYRFQLTSCLHGCSLSSIGDDDEKNNKGNNEDEEIDDLDEVEEVEQPRKKLTPKSSRPSAETSGTKRRVKQSRDDEEVDDLDEVDQPRKKVAPKDSRVYVHTTCGSQTKISGADFDHLTDPFWLCTGTYCCECQKHVSLGAVYWKNTGEPIANYRRRLRRKAPTFIKVWHYGLGPGLGSVFGSLISLAVAMLTPGRTQPLWYFILIGALARCENLSQPYVRD